MNLPDILTNPIALFLVILFLELSIFVHEYGHFIAAKKRGLKVTRFSIFGIGPRVWGWTGKDGVDYCFCALPIGAFVMIPQMGEMQGIEGEAGEEDEKLPPAGYWDKMIVAVMGAVFNIIFAFFLATILWLGGKPTAEGELTTEVGYVAETVVQHDGEEVPSPAAVAGLQPGDIIVSIDGSPVEDWKDIASAIAMGSGRSTTGDPIATIELERARDTLSIEVPLVLITNDHIRMLGVSPKQRFMMTSLEDDMPAADAGFEDGDIVLSLDGFTVFSFSQFVSHLQGNSDRSMELVVDRDGETYRAMVQPKMADNGQGELVPRVGFLAAYVKVKAHIPPHEQIAGMVETVFKTLGALISPSSDIKLRNMSGIVGIVDIGFHFFKYYGFLDLLWIFVLINVNLAVFNLMPIPVLDGGHMLFATIGKLRGKQLPINFVASVQSGFAILLLMMFVYVTFHDIRRKVQPEPSAKVEETQEAAEEE